MRDFTVAMNRWSIAPSYPAHMANDELYVTDGNPLLFYDGETELLASIPCFPQELCACNRERLLPLGNQHAVCCNTTYFTSSTPTLRGSNVPWPFLFTDGQSSLPETCHGLRNPAQAPGNVGSTGSGQGHARSTRSYDLELDGSSAWSTNIYLKRGCVT
jgi:hypothetical protein